MLAEIIVVAGVPRSGTTWIGKVLSRADDMLYCHEPDNEHGNLLGYIYKQRLPRFPYVPPGDPRKNSLYHIFDSVVQGKYLFGYGKSSRVIKMLLGISEEAVEQEIAAKEALLNPADEDSFQPAVSGRVRSGLARLLVKLPLCLKRSPEAPKILVKSVHCILALPYIQQHFGVEIVLVLRHPANIVLSHRKLANPDMHRNLCNQQKLVNDYLAPFKENLAALDHPLEKAGAQVGAFYYVLGRQLADHPEWHLVRHEQFCREPATAFKQLFERLGLSWSAEIEERISGLNKEGEGYDYRRIAEKQIDKWKRELSSAHMEQIRTGYRIFPPAFYTDFGKGNAQ